VGWGEGLDQAVDYLNARPDADRLLVATNYNHAVRPWFRGTTAAMKPYLGSRYERLPSPNYYIIYINSAQRESIPPEARPLIAADRPDFVGTVNGVPYAWVYRVPWASEHPREAPTEGVDEEYEE
jgi:hypothetical protein